MRLKLSTRLRAALIGIGSIMDLDGRATLRRMMALLAETAPPPPADLVRVVTCQYNRNPHVLDDECIEVTDLPGFVHECTEIWSIGWYKCTCDEPWLNQANRCMTQPGTIGRPS